MATVRDFGDAAHPCNLKKLVFNPEKDNGQSHLAIFLG
jgi:hypothetical protein